MRNSQLHCSVSGSFSSLRSYQISCLSIHMKPQASHNLVPFVYRLALSANRPQVDAIHSFSLIARTCALYDRDSGCSCWRQGFTRTTNTSKFMIEIDKLDQASNDNNVLFQDK